MKVVLFCGGLGTRLREYTEAIPKPMVRIGHQPILWYVMKYYAHFGHTDFILCLGYRGDVIKEYFLNYNECLANDFVMRNGQANPQMNYSDIRKWNITFVDTGQNANIGQRLMAVRKYVEGEELFLANYSDGLSDLPLDTYLDFMRTENKIAGFISVRPNQTFHVVQTDRTHLVTEIAHVEESVRINGGFFAFKGDIFSHMRPSEELVDEPFRRLIERKQLVAYPYDGFWKCMDTFKDKQQFEDLYAAGETPWVVWKHGEEK